MCTAQELLDSELLSHIDSFNFPLESGKEECKKQLLSAFCTYQTSLEKRQQDILRLRNDPKGCTSIIESLRELKPYEEIVLNRKSTDTTKAAEGQIFFQGETTKVFNTIPYLLTFLVLCKLYLFPILGLCTPLFLFVTPYFILRQLFNMEMTWPIYKQIMLQMILGFKPSDTWTLKHTFQGLWMVLSLGQGIVQPFFTSYHTSKLDKTIVEQGIAFYKIHSTLKTILNYMKKQGVFRKNRLQLPSIPTDPREIVAWMNDEPSGVKAVFTLLGRISVLFTIANDSTWHPVHWSDSSTVYLNSFSDLAISRDSAIQSSIQLHGHSLLTGPNRGGKSSSLRAILQQVILGQVFGFTKNASGSWKPFFKLFTRLKSHDTAGKESLFEMEVRRASQMIHGLESIQSPALVLIDELFHSTNPPDAETSARIFLEQLWEHKHARSIISTHIFSLCEDPPSHLQTYCCQAEINTDMSIVYSYELEEGICKVSSVYEVLEEAGLLPNRA